MAPLVVVLSFYDLIWLIFSRTVTEALGMAHLCPVGPIFSRFGKNFVGHFRPFLVHSAQVGG